MMPLAERDGSNLEAIFVVKEEGPRRRGESV